MTDTKGRAVYRSTKLDEFPNFDASYHIDEQGTPTSVKIWSTTGDDEVSTEWISCQATFAVPIEAIR